MVRYVRPDLRWQDSIQNAAGDYKNFPTAHRVPKTITGIMERRKFYRISMNGDADRQHLSSDTVDCCGPKYHGQYQIRGGSSDKEDPEADIRIEDTVHCRDSSAGNKSQSQHTTCKAAGNGKKQKR